MGAITRGFFSGSDLWNVLRSTSFSSYEGVLEFWTTKSSGAPPRAMRNID